MSLALRVRASSWASRRAGREAGEREGAEAEASAPRTLRLELDLRVVGAFAVLGDVQAFFFNVGAGAQADLIDEATVGEIIDGRRKAGPAVGVSAKWIARIGNRA